MSTTVSKETIVTDSVTRYSLAAAEQLSKLSGLDSDLLRMISKPKREIAVEVPLRKDDGKVTSFKGFRVHPRTVQRRFAFPPDGRYQRSAHACPPDESENRGGEHSLRRRQGRHLS